MLTRLRIGTAVLVTATIMALASFGVRAAEQLTMSFVMPTPPGPYLLPYFIAQDLGWYQKAGLKVDERVVTGDANSLRALISGEADTTFVGPGSIMQAFISGGQLRIIGSFQPIVDYRIVARPDAGNDLNALSTKRWASSSVGGMVQVLPQMAMRKHGIDTSKAQFMSVGGQAARYQAVVAGTVDATVIDTAIMVRGTKEGKLRFVRSIADDFPKMGYVYFPVRTSALSDPKKRQALEIFIREGIRGARYIMDDPRAAAEVMERRLKSSDVESMTEILKEMNRLGVWGVNGGLERDIFEFSEATLRDMGEITAPVAYEKLVDTSIIDAALKVLGKR